MSHWLAQGEKPDTLSKVDDPGMKAFVELCLAPVAQRPSAAELLVTAARVWPGPGRQRAHEPRQKHAMLDKDLDRDQFLVSAEERDDSALPGGSVERVVREFVRNYASPRSGRGLHAEWKSAGDLNRRVCPASVWSVAQRPLSVAFLADGCD